MKTPRFILISSNDRDGSASNGSESRHLFSRLACYLVVPVHEGLPPNLEPPTSCIRNIYRGRFRTAS